MQSHVFEFLRLADIEVPEDIRPDYATLAGTLIMRSAPALLEVRGKSLSVNVLTPLHRPGKSLVGFEVLKEFDVALLKEKTSLPTIHS